MDDIRPSLPLPQHKRLNQRWQAKLELGFDRRDQRSFLAHRLHYGPLVVQKSLHPEGEGVCHAVVVHPPGGVAGGDALQLHVTVADGAHALLTTPGAGKWYKANGAPATQDLSFDLSAGATLEWFPQENILFDAAQVRFGAQVNLAADAKFAAWEVVCLGRQAQKEAWFTGHYQLNAQIRRAGKLIWNECAFLNADDVLKSSQVGLANAEVFATFVICAGAVPVELVQACREIVLEHAQTGITALPEVLCIRYVGHASQQAKHYFEACWLLLRPWYAGREVVRPRIWNT